MAVLLTPICIGSCINIKPKLLTHITGMKQKRFKKQILSDVFKLLNMDTQKI